MPVHRREKERYRHSIKHAHCFIAIIQVKKKTVQFNRWSLSMYLLIFDCEMLTNILSVKSTLFRLECFRYFSLSLTLLGACAHTRPFHLASSLSLSLDDSKKLHIDCHAQYYAVEFLSNDANVCLSYGRAKGREY